MGKKYLIDTNILIYLTKSEIPEAQIDFIDQILKNSFNISVITKIEFLGWNKHTEQGYLLSKEILAEAEAIELNKIITEKAIDIKRKTNLKLGDAIIGATALEYEFILITRNIKDFQRITGVELFNPFEDVSI